MKKILLINPSFKGVYGGTNLENVVLQTPPIGLACIAGSLLRENHDVRIIDFNLSTNDKDKLVRELKEFNPDFVGITIVTPLVSEAESIGKIIKETNNQIVVIGGGAHCSSFPEASLKEMSLDIVVVGEGDYTILEIVNGRKFSEIKGIAYKDKNKNIFINERRELIKNLDDLPMPAFHIFEINNYKTPLIIARENPVTWFETSRGCPYGCIYCNKSVFGPTFRAKSPERVVAEFIRLKDLGFKELHLADDNFTFDIKRAKRICDLLIEKKVNIIWGAMNGIRVDKADLELLKKMKQAGCYRIHLGIESGNQKILNGIKKGTTIEQIVRTVKYAKEAGLEIGGYFMIGLPGETEETMQDTINLAKFLKLDLNKISITIPLPSTELFKKLDEKKLIKTYDWDAFKIYSLPSRIYDHENLPWETIEKYSKKFYRTVYLNPRFILKRIKRAIKYKTLKDDIKAAFSIKWI
ncbi:hypothetical protein A2331_02590 [Candidatus Falkowbacteria bacterium RIFOXYB2_FULL_34_18]|uniref:Uncharacterized protein n=1 Tax=Candidatus Falkowbacteria bacterium RIFOXYD2_FULL_34_120 TaxID=1798007 RepID=A0A1F5TS47_9BACT|nr:MAG: hypothetical protein A2331_02590 [Candidatus Falkowbacteria bacterium RIFOXYB2_FULL_34_18]OGF29628.1 MAG: hypothetical protein A2500_00620 [Candidatus Falkowbacteria bacterium RIFOXYC12_FULL_34_55]OGF37355.1 MAG: hypothetical protein A2466_01390 [Candidatus Falkowbacteria bacterium RIFOXYC2_FULL_34_220]OGF39093.1 MAG: hypothetical protein A2515_00040 [Candidatus Falkowbacteria bacterium RIFOXYD12_FULL_34_57]OGF41617.1 MAG: hypothetical protein A2531_06275 [Candidatus Falkowbacteria bact